MKQLTYTQKRQSAAGNVEKWRENCGHIVTLAIHVHVNAVLNLSNIVHINFFLAVWAPHGNEDLP